MLALVLAAVIYSTTSATADSGGNSVGSGGTVTTGSQNASSETSVYTSGGNSGSNGTVTVEVTSTANGETVHESKTVEVSGDEPVEITADASASSGGSNESVTNVQAEITSSAPLVPKPESDETADSLIQEFNLETETALETKGFVSTIVKVISDGFIGLFGKLFSFFGV